MARIPLTEAQLMERLKDQVYFIQESSKKYDEGMHAEAVRIAASIRILMHDTSSQRSLLGQLKSRYYMRYMDTSHPFSPNNLLPHQGLTFTRIDYSGDTGKQDFLPNMQDGRAYPKCHWKPCGPWWERDIVVKDSEQRTLTRKDLILKAAETDGGAHVDPKIEEVYHAMKTGESAGWFIQRNGITSPVEVNYVYPSIRQISYELMNSLHSYYPDVLGLTIF